MNNNDLLTRRVAKILPSKEEFANLLNSKKIRLFQGFDPTGGHLHLGHTIGLRKLMEFAAAGHEVIMLFGTGTVLVGDPSEREEGRKLITEEEIENNIKDWKRQVAPIVDFDRVKIVQNGDWLTKMTLKDIIKVASNISSVQLFKRENFTRRIEKGDTVWYHETMYPLLQGYDSVVMDVDLEIGGTDQEFNMLIGRELQHKMNKHDKFVLETPMILGTDGRTMSKTSGNCIFLDAAPEEMYSKLMGVQDELITTYFELLTNAPSDEIQALDPNTPVENKKRLAYTITRDFHGDEGAKKGQIYFETIVQSKAIDPREAPIVVTGNLFETLKNAKLGVSNAEIKRVIEQGGVEVDGVKISEPGAEIHGKEIKFGKNIRRRLEVK